MTYNQFNNESLNKMLLDRKLEVLDYVNSKKNCHFKCLICGKIFEAKYDNVRYWKYDGCNDCCKKKDVELKRQKRSDLYFGGCKNESTSTNFNKEDDMFVKMKIAKLNERKNQNIDILSYNVDTEIAQCNCNICNSIFESSYDSLFKGCGHRSCSLKYANKPNVITLDEIIKRSYEFDNTVYNDFSNYTKTNDYVKSKCLMCGYEWDRKAKDTYSHGCPECAIKIRAKSRTNYISRDEIQKEFELYNLVITDNDEVKCYGKTQDIKYECVLCGEKYFTSYNYFKEHLNGCKVCNKNIKKQKNILNLIEKLKDVGSSLTLLRWNGLTNNKAVFLCSDCGNEYIISPHDLSRRSYLCKYCNGSSMMEDITVRFLIRNNIKYYMHHGFYDLRGINNGMLTYDFYLIDYNILIELQGIQHFKPVELFGGVEQFNIQKEHDKRKREYALVNDIKLIEIAYYDMDDIEKILSNELNIINKKSVS